MEPILYMEKEYTNAAELITAMEENWQGGAEILAFLKETCEKEDAFFQDKYVFPMLARLLQEDGTFTFDESIFVNLTELTSYLQMIADQSVSKFKSKGAKLFLDKTHLDPVFAGWLLQQGNLCGLQQWVKRWETLQ